MKYDSKLQYKISSCLSCRMLKQFHKMSHYRFLPDSFPKIFPSHYKQWYLSLLWLATSRTEVISKQKQEFILVATTFIPALQALIILGIKNPEEKRRVGGCFWSSKAVRRSVMWFKFIQFLLSALLHLKEWRHIVVLMRTFIKESKHNITPRPTTLT